MAADISATSGSPPRRKRSAWAWARANLFNGWLNSIITLLMIWVITRALVGLVRWAATTPGWVAVLSNLRLFFVGVYPATQVWRVELVVLLVALLLGASGGVWRDIARVLAFGFAAVMAALLLVSFSFPPAAESDPLATPLFLGGAAALVGLGYALGAGWRERVRTPLIIAWLLLPVAATVLIRGFGSGGPLPLVESNLWGGLLLTIILAVVGIVASFPLGVLLALGRRSSLPAIRWFCILYIELIRGVPLVTVLFMAQLMLPLFLPGNVRIDSVVRAMVAITLFSAAYLAENVRGGLQALPRGQTEAARALGLNVVQTTLLITLPQALRAVIPVLVGQFIALFKDTSLVTIVALTDLLGIAQAVVAQPAWTQFTGGVWREVFLVVALTYWIFSFTMSRVSQHLEQKLNVGRH